MRVHRTRASGRYREQLHWSISTSCPPAMKASNSRRVGSVTASNATDPSSRNSGVVTYTQPEKLRSRTELAEISAARGSTVMTFKRYMGHNEHHFWASLVK